MSSLISIHNVKLCMAGKLFAVKQLFYFKHGDWLIIIVIVIITIIIIIVVVVVVYLI